MKKKPYTVVGIYPDTDQRYCDVVDAATPDSAENKVRARFPEMLIAAVFEGSITPVDTKTYGSD
jgi:hypothetical protein